MEFGFDNQGPRRVTLDRALNNLGDVAHVVRHMKEGTMAKTKAPSSGRANDDRSKRLRTREVRAMESAARWLRRRGAARENPETRRAYSTAARQIHELAKAS